MSHHPTEMDIDGHVNREGPSQFMHLHSLIMQNLAVQKKGHDQTVHIYRLICVYYK